MTDFLTSVTARVGYAWNDWLLYAKGGAAWAGNRYSAFDTPGLRFRGIGDTASAGPRAPVSNGRFGMIGRSSSNTTITGFGTRSVTFIDNVTGNVGPDEHQSDHSGHQARSELSRLRRVSSCIPSAVVRKRWAARFLYPQEHTSPTKTRTPGPLSSSAHTLVLHLGASGDLLLVAASRAEDTKSAAVPKQELQAKLAYCQVCHGAIGARFSRLLSDTAAGRTTTRIPRKSAAGLY